MNKLSEEILSYLLDSSDSMISIINDRMRYVAVNEPFCRSFNMDKRQLVGKCPSELWGENTYREKILSNIERSLGGETVKYRAFFDVPDSPGKYYDVTYRPFKSPGTSLNYTIIETKGIGTGDKLNGQFIDIDQKYKYSESYLPFGMFSCDRQGAILGANDAFYDLLEVSRNDRDKLNFNELLKTDHRFTQHLSSGKTGETATFSNVRMLTPGGREIFARISSHIREDEHSGIITNGTLEDVTREVVLERQLQQAQRLETLGTLAGGVAHDFNTILTTISGYSEMTMEEAGENAVVCEYMESLKAAINKAQNIINQMLVFSRQLEQHRVDLEAYKILKEAVDFVKTSLPSNIKLRTKYESPGGFIYADPTQLFRVFLNIMTNALHAMGEQEGTLTISLAGSKIRGKSYVDIGIADTGKGIDPSIMERIFEPFFSTRKDDGGTGMGLAVAHGIITGIGGEINVESAPGKGSLFTIRIPLEKTGSDTGGYSRD
ncbi:MAG: ATP-binding protein [Bacteroidales bacterium]|jgi:PAS domain S-box-containing protein|nr:ATP-binding protein [Bacteroidales bacterium]